MGYPFLDEGVQSLMKVYTIITPMIVSNIRPLNTYPFMGSLYPKKEVGLERLYAFIQM